MVAYVVAGPVSFPSGEGEREEHVVAYDTRLDGVEIEVEGRVALGLSAFDGFLGEVFVADDLVYVVLLR